MATVSLLEDGTEVCLPMPGSWSDSEDESGDEHTQDATPCDSEKSTSESPSIAESSALAMLTSIPAHSHADRGLANAEGEPARLLAALAEEAPLPEHSCDRFSCAAMDSVGFLEHFAGEAGHPAVIEGVPQAEGWPCATKWNGQEAFMSKYGQLPVQVTEMGSFHGLGKPFRVELSLQEYAAYAGSNTADWPFYVWERNFEGARRCLLDDFRSPKVFEDDLYDITPEIREFLPLTCHLFVLVGGRRTGSNMHTDPKWSSAWNTLLTGKKRWVLFPRDTPAKEIGALEGDAYKDGGPQAYWWLDHYPRLRAQGARLGMVDIIQHPGDTVFIPSGWWHATLNLPDDGEDVTVACTRNVLPAASLPYVLPCMQAADPSFARTFVDAVRRLRPDVASILPKNSTISVDRPAIVGDCESWRLYRRHAEGLSIAECRRKFIRKGIPLIIEGLAPHLISTESCGLSREWLSAHFGEKCVGVYRNFVASDHRQGQDDKADLLRLREVLSILRKGGKEAEGLYIYDLSLPLQLPGLLDHVRMPRYFAHCYLQQTMRPHCCQRSWPTLFIGRAGSQAKLHVDQWHGHFWMHMVSGRKRWIIFHPEDAHLLCPHVPEGRHHPIFPNLSDLESGILDAPGFKSARRLDVILEEGDTLFVPGGAPHLVVNLTDTVAVAGNFIDESNFDVAMADIRGMAEHETSGEGAMAGLLAALDEIDFEPDRGMHEELLPPRHLAVRYRDFAGGIAARWGAIPPDDEH